MPSHPPPLRRLQPAYSSCTKQTAGTAISVATCIPVECFCAAQRRGTGPCGCPPDCRRHDKPYQLLLPSVGAAAGADCGAADCCAGLGHAAAGHMQAHPDQAQPVDRAAGRRLCGAGGSRVRRFCCLLAGQTCPRRTCGWCICCRWRRRCSCCCRGWRCFCCCTAPGWALLRCRRSCIGVRHRLQQCRHAACDPPARWQ